MRLRYHRGDRGATMVEYALGIALLVVVCLGAIQRIQDRGTDRLEGSDERISLPSDGQYYPGLATTTTVSGPTTTATGTTPAHLQSNPTIVVENTDQNEWRITVTFKVVDSSNQGLIGATLTGNWSASGPHSSPTGTCSTSTSDGLCTIQYLGIRDNDNLVTFQVTSITGGSGFFWQPAAPGEGSLAISCNPPLNASCD